MVELIPTGSAPAINSAEIAELVGSRHDNVKRTIERLVVAGLIRNPPLEDSEEINNLGLPRKVQVYRFEGERGKRDSIVVVAQLSPEFTARLVDRWQQLEAAIAARPAFDPASLSKLDVLRLAIESEERRLEAEAKVAELLPKARFRDQVVAAPDALSIAQAAKILNTGRNRLASWMRAHHWLQRNNEPYQEKIECGLLDVKLGQWEHPEKGIQRSVTTLVTGKGLVKLQELGVGQLNGAAA